MNALKRHRVRVGTIGAIDLARSVRACFGPTRAIGRNLPSLRLPHGLGIRPTKRRGISTSGDFYKTAEKGDEAAALAVGGQGCDLTGVDYLWLWLLPWAASECSRAVLA